MADLRKLPRMPAHTRTLEMDIREANALYTCRDTARSPEFDGEGEESAVVVNAQPAGSINGSEELELA